MRIPTLPRRTLESTYDYIVIGSGSGGSVVARRLIDGTDATVLLVEAGPSSLGVAEIDDPAAWVPLGKSRYDWGHEYAPAPKANGRRIGIPRGRVLGGSSATNAMMWYRGHPRDYDAWGDAGCEGWDFATCLPYFKRAEDWQGGETKLRGADGPLRIETPVELHRVAQALIDGAAELGIPVIDDPNGPSNEGAAPSNFNISGGRRWSSATGYLLPVLDHPRLTVALESPVTGLVVEQSRCVGIRHLVEGAEIETRATTQVILAAGAIETPRLLMLSGIGDPAWLEPIGMKVRYALEGVGKNFQDHPLVQAVVMRAREPLGPTQANGGGSMVNWKSRSDLHQPDIHAFPVQGNSAEQPLRDRYDLSGDVFSLGAGLMQSHSVGHVRPLSANPSGPLEIQPNFLVDSRDLEATIVAVETMIAMSRTKAFTDISTGLAAPDTPLGRDALITFIAEGCSTFFHCCGSAKMGRDAMAVTDHRLRVHGMDGLTIADASVIPIIPTCNTHAPVTMIAERAADFLIEAA